MSEQDGKQSSTKLRRSRKISIANQHNGIQASAAQCPANEDKEAWKAYWREQGLHWRTEPEIDAERQKYLAERRCIWPDIEQGIYPYKDIKLSRADVEWLLTTHENGRGPVDWADENQRTRDGLDMRGANLCELNLSNLPLTRLRGGLNDDERMFATVEICDMAAVHLEGSNLQKIHLERADLYRAHLEEVNLYAAYLEKAYLIEAHLTGANLYRAHLVRTRLRKAHLQKVRLGRAHLVETELEDAVLSDEKLVGPRLADANWSSTNLSVVNWSNVKMLDDEYKARQKMRHGKVKDRDRHLKEYGAAVRANRQLAVTLQAQGLNEIGARFAYRAQLLQRKVFWYQRKFGQYLFSLFLDLLAGYGYRPGRSLIAYILVIAVFATIYHQLGTCLTWNEAIVISISWARFLP
jgi:uncharacterized protein YjbI with pentapeptide repeats